MTEKIYTLTQRRMRDALRRIRDFESLKQWIDRNVVGDPVTVSDWTPKTLDERRVILREQVEAKYAEALRDGFAFNGGTFAANGPKRHRVVELVTQQNSGRGMPRGKTTKRFVDSNGQAHDLNAQQIIDLAEAGSDHVEAADDRLEELYAEIAAAISQADLDSIDVTTGWP